MEVKEEQEKIKVEFLENGCAYFSSKSLFDVLKFNRLVPTHIGFDSKHNPGPPFSLTISQTVMAISLSKEYDFSNLQNQR